MLHCEFVDECKAMDMKQTSNCSGFKAHRLVYHIYSVYTVYIYIYIYIYIALPTMNLGIAPWGSMYFISMGQVKSHVVNTVHIKKLTILCEESA